MRLRLAPIGVFQEKTVPHDSGWLAGRPWFKRSAYAGRSGGRVVSRNSMFAAAIGKKEPGPSSISATGRAAPLPATSRLRSAMKT
jgi:hypothetical protein